MTTSSTRPRLRAPELRGRGWLNTAEDLTLADLRGRVVVLDFWTFCCVNCLHVLDELRPLEERFAGELVVVGVHSPKFVHEADPEALAAAVERYAVHHPVLDDPELVTWSAYTARAWPTLVVIDPEGYIVASMSGEGHGPGLAALVEDLLAEHRSRGTLQPGDSPYVAPPEPAGRLRFPGKVAALPDGSVVISDTAHHEVVQLSADLSGERARYGGAGVLVEPQGVLALPAPVAARCGVDVLVADAAGHRVLGIRLRDGAVVPLAGTGRQLRERAGGGPALGQDLSTPWDLAWFDGRVVIAMAGTHQLWALDLAPAGQEGTLDVVAGTSAEGIRDGGGDVAWFAQPSGLAVSPDGETLWVADAETSAVRAVRRSKEPGVRPGEAPAYLVETHVGQGLFDFGHRDGPAGEALLQHPLGVSVLPDGSVVVCDTYNGAIRRMEPGGEVTTLAVDLAEPSAALVRREPHGATVLVVVESAAHRLTALPVPVEATRVNGLASRTRRPPTDVAPGAVTLRVAFVPPTGQKLDDRWGDPTRLMVSATPDALVREGAGTSAGLTRTLVLDPRVGDGVLHVSVQAAACDDDADGQAAEHAACHLYQQDWGIPLVLVEGAATTLELDLRGV